MARQPRAVGPADLARDRSHVLTAFDVSRETAARLDRFVALLLQWQERINLVGSSTVPQLWSRHIADSLQLLNVGAGVSARVWIDLGSGAGFPGLVIACAMAERPGAEVHLIESNVRKAAFLREVARHIGAPAQVHAARIEKIGPELGADADIITARAVAPLNELFTLIAPMLRKGSQALLLKGQDVGNELTESARYWMMELDIVQSKTSPEGRVLIVRSLARR